MEYKEVMKYESTLPEDFNGVFHFTNWSDEEFVGKWGGKEYHFPATSTIPMVMSEYSPLEIQNIRKKFAKDLAEKEYFRSTGYETLMRQEKNLDGSPRLNSIHQAGTYSLDQLTPFIQRALEQLPISKAIVTEAPKMNLEDKISRNRKGGLNTKAIDSNEDLVQMAKSND